MGCRPSVAVILVISSAAGHDHSPACAVQYGLDFGADALRARRYNMRRFKSFLPLTTAAAAAGFAVFSFGGHQTSAQQQEQQPVVDLPLTHATCVGLDLGAPMPP